ncbi:MULTISPECIES: cupin [unclassified Pseudomonas]|uniref:cupin domain-containing protein n=1 Tax=unclassified Pseudomonas TaxID=196821 RepID=UPI00083982B0|nr:MULTISPECIES: cupin [unclassified Pseudomonas]QIH10502.1 cupin [Pseudomonas sp. BIOMIG1BAC]UMZ10866.1 cupin [Pseudomonas sp. MPFS]
MSLLSFELLSRQLPEPWQSKQVGQVGPARIKVLRMDRRPYAEEIHDYNEGLLVTAGCLRLGIEGNTVEVLPGQMYLVQAGQAHSVLPGSHGTLVIIDV